MPMVFCACWSAGFGQFSKIFAFFKTKDDVTIWCHRE